MALKSTPSQPMQQPPDMLVLKHCGRSRAIVPSPPLRTPASIDLTTFAGKIRIVFGHAVILLQSRCSGVARPCKPPLAEVDTNHGRSTRFYLL